jgi:hypothetical protein
MNILATTVFTYTYMLCGKLHSYHPPPSQQSFLEEPGFVKPRIFISSCTRKYCTYIDYKISLMPIYLISMKKTKSLLLNATLATEETLLNRPVFPKIASFMVGAADYNLQWVALLPSSVVRSTHYKRQICRSFLAV